MRECMNAYNSLPSLSHHSQPSLRTDDKNATESTGPTEESNSQASSLRIACGPEMLHLFHNLANVWTKEIWYVTSEIQNQYLTKVRRKVVTQNWLLNPTGKANAFVEIDLVQEHLNFWIKVSKLMHTS